MDKYRIPNLARACQILKMFGESGGQLSCSQMARRFAMPRTTVLRIVETLRSEGLLQREGTTYSAGAELIRLGLQGFDPVRLRESSAPVLRTLAHATGETAHLAILCGDKALIAEVCDSPAPVSAVRRSGGLDEIHASAPGKVLLAFHPSASQEAFLARIDLFARTPNTLTTRAALRAECARIRRLGFALDDEEYHLGVRCLAAPVRDAAGVVVAAIGITASTATFPKRRIPMMAKSVLSAAEKLSQSLGAKWEWALRELSALEFRLTMSAARNEHSGVKLRPAGSSQELVDRLAGNRTLVEVLLEGR
jgi:IclR family KDG regulon transcriptional repressor